MANQSNWVCVPPERLEALEKLVEAISNFPFGESLALPWCIESFPKLKAALDDCKKWELHTNEDTSDVPMQSTTGGFTLHYSNGYPATKDCYVDDTARQLAYQDVKTSTGLVVEAALCYIMEGVLEDVSIIIEGRPLTINPDYGIVTDIARFPSRDYSKRLMLAMIGKYKKPYKLWLHVKN
jgi:hypothetical protein